MMKLTVKDIEETPIIDEIMEQYGKGDNTHYKIVDEDGEALAVLTPFDGPWESVLEDVGDGSGDGMLSLPQRICSQLGLQAGDDVQIIPREDGSIEIKK